MQDIIDFGFSQIRSLVASVRCEYCICTLYVVLSHAEEPPMYEDNDDMRYDLNLCGLYMLEADLKSNYWRIMVTSFAERRL